MNDDSCKLYVIISVSVHVSERFHVELNVRNRNIEGNTCYAHEFNLLQIYYFVDFEIVFVNE